MNRAKILGYTLFVLGIIIQIYLIFHVKNYEFNLTSLYNLLGGTVLILSPSLFVDLVKYIIKAKSNSGGDGDTK